ncbi:unnamed protein product [Mycena citricolor]|uniref:RTA1-domain-containing protein n=1 Tax=Mycena citricolor TaxID=2018698 RepID=A0AAD2HX03_9AGAR|nr:unnamed protein product [Mycena citricolor]CAK5283663.1 unnamed protein product [Mycena citricolor]
MSRLTLLLTFAACFASVFAAEVIQRDTNTDTPIGGYAPKRFLSMMGVIAYGQSAIALWIQFFWNKPKHPFMLTLNFGMTAMTVGFVLRWLFANPPYTLGKYIAWDMFILLSPCLFLAIDYMLLSRLVDTFDTDVVDRCLVINPNRLVKIFVWSDALTFFLQISGGGLTASHNTSSANLGTKIALIGLILQAVSFLLFTFLMLTFAFRVANHFPHIWRPETPAPFKILSTAPIEDWRILIYIMSITCVGIMTRSVFRIAEFAGGYNGRIATHEVYFYLFDALPLMMTMSLYCVVWPTRFLQPPEGKFTHHRGSSQEQLKLNTFQQVPV